MSLWQRGREILHCCSGLADPMTGKRWTADTLVPIWSATKGPASVALLMALEEAGIGLDVAVAELWPQFAQQGKGAITLGQLLSHRAGLSALDEAVAIEDRAAVQAALERQRPLWEPGTRQGYHPRTFGFLLEALMQRLTGAESLGQWISERLLRPMQLDLWLGLPAEEDARVAKVKPGRVSLEQQSQPFFKAYLSSGSLTQRSFMSPRGLHAVTDFNLPSTWRAGYASMGGVASARGLAGFYAMLANAGQDAERRTWVSARACHLLSQSLSQDQDLILQETLAFSAGMMMDPLDGAQATASKLRCMFGPHRQSFGHPGAGGSLGFADPQRQLSFALVINELEPGALPSRRVQELVAALG